MKGEPVYSSSRNIEDDIFAFKFMGKKGSKFFAIIPVKYDNRIVASINLYSCRINKISFNSLLALEAFAMRAGAIIARVNAVWALQENEQKYRSLLETMNEGFIITDDDFMITYVNNRICEMLEYRYDEIIGLPITYFFDETNKKLLYNQMRRRSRGNQKPYEITWLKADGRNIATIVAPKAILNESGQFKGSFAVITDISELKETSKILKKKEQDLIEKTSILQEVNTALRVLLKKRDEDKNELEEKVLLNVKQLINPIIRKIKKTGLDQKQKTLFDIIESNLSDIISPYSRSLFSKHLELTPTEFDISNFIRDGKTTKEISEVMNLSNRTIETHRFRIRKKLGLNKKRVSLRSYLLSLQ
jgi:PAS domain S-box-containing protein